MATSILLDEMSRNWWMFLVRVALAVFPGTGALALVWLIGAYAIAFGVVLVALGFRLRGRRARVWGRKEAGDPGASR